MRFNPVLISCFLFASAVLANPRRPQQRDLPERSSDPPAVVDSDTWGGAIWILEPGTFNHVHAIFEVPNVASENGLDSYVDVLVVIDGYNCPNDAMFGLGLQLFAPHGGSTNIEAVILNSTTSVNPETLDIPISVGDVIQLDIIAYNATSGHVSIDNFNNHVHVEQNVQLSQPLCGQTAGWIVSDVGAVGSFSTLANYGTVIFTGASAGTRGGTYYQPYGATLLRNQGKFESGAGDSKMGSTIAYSDSPLWITYLYYK
ncbi:peptidase A4 family-domain-containing protein [Boletus reticuloceps]|uniref:Peptidase A4 family-domain-containing protein n=1 Tax=Boletus reticuloceps TaxID=495285 RepID=A0A8I2Z3B5_9AGAM|nr:peptidase A4 family-domain-containing protein [Boletus reticuloceps]